MVPLGATTPSLTATEILRRGFHGCTRFADLRRKPLQNVVAAHYSNDLVILYNRQPFYMTLFHHSNDQGERRILVNAERLSS
jgi:hypothetical protein